MTLFSPSFMDELKGRADIVSVVSEHVVLRKVGRSHKGLCPFHKEKSPSFTVRADPPVFHCFGCGAGGDAFRFVMETDRLPFIEAVARALRLHPHVADSRLGGHGEGGRGVTVVRLR